jgi:serine/threonine protein kinase
MDKEKKNSGEKKKVEDPKVDTKGDKKKVPETIQVEEYQINTAKDCIGEGGFGVVYRGYNTNTGEFVAIKKIPLKNKKKEDIMLIKNEISLMAGLNDPHIVRYIDNKEKGGFLYIVMEYLETGSLASLVKRYKLTEDMISKYISQVLEGLKYLHGEGIIHRDIKGDNVLLTKKSEIKLADFGVAQALDNIEENDIAGTPNWMAPEVISLAGAQYTSDIWSVGCVIIELVTGKPPYHDIPKMGAMYKIVMDDHPPIPVGLTSSCMDFLMFCFKKDPGLRKGATELLKHPWISKTEIPKQITPKKEVKPVVPVKTTKDVSPIAKKDILSKFKEDDDEPIVRKIMSPSPSKTLSGPIKKPLDESWDDDDDSFSSGSSTISKGSQIVKKLQEMKIGKPQEKDWRQEAIAESPLNVLQGKSKSIAKWTEDDDDKGLVVKKGLRISLKKETNEVNEDELEQAFEQEAQDLGGDFNADKQHEDEFLRVLTTLVTQSSEADIKKSLEKLLEFAQDNSLQKIFNLFMRNTCLIPIVDILVASKNEAIQTCILKLLRIISKDNKETQENLALIGAFPKIMKFSSIEYAKGVRQEANRFIYYLCMESKNMHGIQMFIASAGLPVLTKFLKHSANDIKADVASQEMISRSLDIILHLLNLTAGKNHKRDFCRLFSESDILIEFYNILNNLKTFDTMGQSIFAICNIFSSYGDKVVKQGMSGKEIMKSLFGCYSKVKPDQKLMILTIIRNLTYEVPELLVATGVLSVLVAELKVLLQSKDIMVSGSMSQKMYFPIMNSLFALCVGPLQLGREVENETVAKEGIIPLLFDTIQKKLQPLDISVRLMNKLSLASPSTSQMFVNANGVQFLFAILKSSEMAAYHAGILDKIVAFLSRNSEETSKVLLQKENIKIVCDVFKERNIELVAPFFNIIARSNKAATLFSMDANFLGVFEKWLNHFKDPKDLKRMIEVLDKLYENCEAKPKFVLQFKDLLIMKSKSPNKQLVRNVANGLLDKFKTAK